MVLRPLLDSQHALNPLLWYYAGGPESVKNIEIHLQGSIYAISVFSHIELVYNRSIHKTFVPEDSNCSNAYPQLVGYSIVVKKKFKFF